MYYYRKHKTRHEKPFGCTFDKCYKTFGSKADWKRHENWQHFLLQSWRCSLASEEYAGRECASLYYRQELFVRHLTDDHGLEESDSRVGDFLTKNRIGRNGQGQFWCGFCRKILPLTQRGLEAWNERFDHIDMKHFKRGQRIDDWVPADGHLTKKEIREEERKKREAEEQTAVESVEGSISDGESEGEDSPSHEDGAVQSAVKAENSTNPRKRKFSPDPLSSEDAGAGTDQQQSEERETVKGRKLTPPSMDEHRSDDNNDDHDHNHDSRPTPHSTDRQHTSSTTRATGTTRMQGIEKEKTFQRSLFCVCKSFPFPSPFPFLRIDSLTKYDMQCQCHNGPCHVVLMTSCVACEHMFCENCILG